MSSLELKLPYDPVFPFVGRLVGLSVSQFVIISSFTSHARIGALVLLMYFNLLGIGIVTNGDVVHLKEFLPMLECFQSLLMSIHQ